MISQERKAAFLQKLERVTAYQEICEQMALAAKAFNAHDGAACRRFLALELPDVWIEYADEGRFVGREAVEYLLDLLLGGERRDGEFTEIYLTTPVVEVAGDGMTGHGVWWCPVPMTTAREDGSLQAIWAWGNLAVDFIRCGETWKIWHFHYFRLFKCRYEQGWVDDLSMINRLNLPAHPGSLPPTYHNPYSPLSVRDGIPAAPRPYESHTDSAWMTETRKDV